MTILIGRRQFTIEWGHCDPAGIVFNARFFEFFDWGTWSLFDAALGVKPHELASVLRHCRHSAGRFRRALHRAGALRRRGGIEIAGERIPPLEFRCRAQLVVRGAVAVEGRETRVWAVRDPADPDKIKGQAIPAEVMAGFQTK